MEKHNHGESDKIKMVEDRHQTHETNKEKLAHKKREEHLRSKLKKAEEEIKTLQDRLLRSFAELDNVRKRTEKEKSQLIQSANADLIKGILPILDDLERSLKLSFNDDASGFRNGIELIYQKLFSILKNQGLTPMETVGQPFDVDKHDALLQDEREGVAPGMVIEEYERGYFLNGQVLRHAKVAVSK
jgi:molecular chaperone GrpE